jgi:hypothetical protein
VRFEDPYGISRINTGAGTITHDLHVAVGMLHDFGSPLVQ